MPKLRHRTKRPPRSKRRGLVVVTGLAASGIVVAVIQNRRRSANAGMQTDLNEAPEQSFASKARATISAGKDTVASAAQNLRPGDGHSDDPQRFRPAQREPAM